MSKSEWLKVKDNRCKNHTRQKNYGCPKRNIPTVTKAVRQPPIIITCSFYNNLYFKIIAEIFKNHFLYYLGKEGNLNCVVITGAANILN